MKAAGVGRDRPGPGGEARAHLRAGRRHQPAGRAGGALPGRHQPHHRRARRRVLGRLLRRRRARGGRAVLARRCCRGRCWPSRTCPTWRRSSRSSTSSRSSARRGRGRAARGREGRVRERSTSTSASSATVPSRPRPGRAARAVQPRLPRLGGPDSQRGRLRDHRAPALLPLAAARAHGRGATARRSTTPAGCSRGCATRWRSRASTPTRPAPGTPGLEPFPDAVAA